MRLKQELDLQKQNQEQLDNRLKKLENSLTTTPEKRKREYTPALNFSSISEKNEENSPSKVMKTDL